MTTTTTASVHSVEQFRVNPAVVLFEGEQDGVNASIYVTEFEPGDGPRLHRHPYPEVFLVEAGIARFEAGGRQLDVGPGNFVVVPPETAHRYENPGPGPLRVLSVHPQGATEQTFV
jgi:mannose-6-phosphate isomerase-like protein (cupin superfamily)